MPWTCPAFPSAAAFPSQPLQHYPSQQQQQGHKQAGQQMERNGSMLAGEGSGTTGHAGASEAYKALRGLLTSVSMLPTDLCSQALCTQLCLHRFNTLLQLPLQLPFPLSVTVLQPLPVQSLVILRALICALIHAVALLCALPRNHLRLQTGKCGMCTAMAVLLVAHLCAPPYSRAPLHAPGQPPQTGLVGQCGMRLLIGAIGRVLT
eukprot:1160438-Pelagomonas_calceolata.AAC.2